MERILKIIFFTIIIVNNQLYAQQESNWSCDLGVGIFKSSINNRPDELMFNPVFEKWELINHQPDLFNVSDYRALDPFPFNMSIGIDGLFTYKKYFMVKIGYSYTNTLGIGGKGHISYTDITTNTEISEAKTMSYTSHQINYFVGPLLPVNDKGAEVYMGISIMPPTFVKYKEEYLRTENGIITKVYNKTFTGFFGNCRTLIGIQVPISENLRMGSEMVFAYFNGIELNSDDLHDEGFKFPAMQWNFTMRYHLK